MSTNPEGNPYREKNTPLVIHAGELVFGHGEREIRTLLGSCVAITLWHPRLQFGGMCHFALPHRPENLESDKPNPRYADDCLLLFDHLVRKRGTLLKEYEGRIFGGGDMLSALSSSRAARLEAEQITPVGDANAAIAFELLTRYNVHIQEADVGEKGYRSIIFDPSCGETQVKFFAVDG